MSRLNNFNSIDSNIIAAAAKQHGTPFYLYDEQVIIDKCRNLLSMPNAYGLKVRYAMKANSNKSILKLISAQGLKIDASSMNEARRANMAGIAYEDIILTTQEAPLDQEMRALNEMMSQGLKYNVCSLRQLRNIGDFAAENKINLAIRIHPGIGTGESATRNTGDKYSCFGVHLSDLEQALEYSKSKKLVFDLVHTHIGSGGDPAVWQSNIDSELRIIEQYFPDAKTVNFGGGLKEARMPDETPADINELGKYAKEKIEQFYQKTGRKLEMEIEPGTYIIAAAGFVVTTVIDKKKTGDEGLNFIVLDGGMEVNTRPLLYASRHPFYIVSQEGKLLSSEYDEKTGGGYQAVLVGRCCESGDSQCLDSCGLSVPRVMAEPETGDYAAIGGAGAYCSAMSLANYNSHVQAPEVLYTRAGGLNVIRNRQTLRQITANET
jgi:diaminopimelate decarboxylase